MIHEMKLHAVYFDMIKSKSKIYEVRLNDEKRQQIKVGDTITFERRPDCVEKVTAQVEELIHFSSFAEMANTLPLAQVGFEKESVDEVVGVYHQFYTVEDESKYGVLAIKVSLCD